MTSIDTARDPDRAEAVAWLAGRLQWERLLDELRDRHDGDTPLRELPEAA